MSNKLDVDRRQVAYHGVPWEDAYGYPQAVRVGDTIHVSGQLSHDASGALVAPASLGDDGRPADFSNMEEQMRATYASASRVLAQFGATLDDVIEETIFVLDMAAAFAVAGKVRKAAYGTDKPQVASTIVETSRLALAEQLIEISYTAKAPRSTD